MAYQATFKRYELKYLLTCKFRPTGVNISFETV